MSTLDIVLVSLGIVIITTALILSFQYSEPKPHQLIALRVILALGAACIASIIPGTVSIPGGPGVELGIRATGAIAIFVIVYKMNPPKRIQSQSK